MGDGGARENRVDPRRRKLRWRQAVKRSRAGRDWRSATPARRRPLLAARRPTATLRRADLQPVVDAAHAGCFGRRTLRRRDSLRARHAAPRIAAPPVALTSTFSRSRPPANCSLAAGFTVGASSRKKLGSPGRQHGTGGTAGEREVRPERPRLDRQSEACRSTAPSRACSAISPEGASPHGSSTATPLLYSAVRPRCRSNGGAGGRRSRAASAGDAAALHPPEEMQLMAPAAPAGQQPASRSLRHPKASVPVGTTAACGLPVAGNAIQERAMCAVSSSAFPPVKVLPDRRAAPAAKPVNARCRQTGGDARRRPLRRPVVLHLPPDSALCRGPAGQCRGDGGGVRLPAGVPAGRRRRRPQRAGMRRGRTAGTDAARPAAARLRRHRAAAAAARAAGTSRPRRPWR